MNNLNNYDQQIKELDRQITELKEDIRVLERVLAQVLENKKRALKFGFSMDESYLISMGETAGFIKVTKDIIEIKKAQIERIEELKREACKQAEGKDS